MGGERPGVGRVIRGLVCLGCLLPSTIVCARMEAPPGGPPDNVPPVVVSTSPDTFAVVDAFEESVTFRFSERISERPVGGTLEEAVVVSPETGEVSVDHGRQSLDVSVEGGFRPGLVYRVRILPAVRDMFGNPMVEPYELVFSTGAEFRRGVVAGEVLDRISGQAVEGARVHALDEGEADDSLFHLGRTDSDGIFAVRYLPPGRYALTAFEDLNRNRSVDGAEPRERREIVLEGEADTVLVSMEILAPDTTPPRIVRGEAVDSATVRLETDDVLDPAESLDLVEVTLSREEGEGPAPDTLLHEYQWEARRQALEEARAEADAAAAVDSAIVADTADADGDAGDVPGADAAPPDTVESPYDPGEPPRAEQTIYVLLAEALSPDVAYTVSVEGLRNIAGTAGGGGEVDVVYEPPPPDTAAADTAAVNGVDPDTPPDGGAADAPDDGSADEVPDDDADDAPDDDDAPDAGGAP